MQVFLAGPKGARALRLEAIANLSAMGHDVMQRDRDIPLPKLLECDAIVLLPGWGACPDAVRDAKLAKATGLSVLGYWPHGSGGKLTHIDIGDDAAIKAAATRLEHILHVEEHGTN